MIQHLSDADADADGDGDVVISMSITSLKQSREIMRRYNNLHSIRILGMIFLGMMEFQHIF
jgi:hypothetical protein